MLRRALEKNTWRVDFLLGVARLFFPNVSQNVTNGGFLKLTTCRFVCVIAVREQTVPRVDHRQEKRWVKQWREEKPFV